MFVFCFFGKLASDSFEKMTDHLYESNWPEYPVQLQKYFILLIANTQMPLYYHGSGIAILNLNTFLKVNVSLSNFNGFWAMVWNMAWMRFYFKLASVTLFSQFFEYFRKVFSKIFGKLMIFSKNSIQNTFFLLDRWSKLCWATIWCSRH